MYKVFLTDDEIVVREGIRSNFPWEQTDFVLAGEAPDGEIALSMLQDIKPDILITDINNPASSSKASSETPAMFDTIRTSGPGGMISDNGNDFNHIPGGANILFMDGHVEFSKYPAEDGSKYWVTSRAILSDGQQYSP